MLVVIAHIQRQAIDRAVIAKGLLVEIVRVMLLNPARADGMQPDGKQKCEHEIKKSGPAEEINYRDIVQDRAYQIGGEPAVPHFDGFQSRRPRYLKKGKEH